jgi:uncharacterized protein
MGILDPVTLVALVLAVVPPVRAGGAPHEEPAVLKTATGDIEGTLELPATTPCPVALIIAGSGPTDRNGNSAMGVRPDSYELLANALAADGIATLRYDKRGIAASQAAGPKEEDLRFEMYIADAAGWVRQLRADKRFTTVTVVGHSEGSLIGMIAARQASADGYVSLEGASEPAADILRTQLKAQLTPEMMAETEKVLESLEAGKTVAQTPPALAALFRPSVQPYLISWFRYDPAKEIARLQVPVLVVQGTHDIQIGEADGRRLAADNKRATLLLLDGMSHVLKDAPAARAEQVKAYTDPSLPLDARLVPAVSKFIEALRLAPAR